MVQFFSKSTAHGIRLARSDCGQSIRLPCLCFGGRGGTPECLQVQAFVHSCSTGSKTNFACVRISSAVCAYILRSYAPNVYELRAVFFFFSFAFPVDGKVYGHISMASTLYPSCAGRRPCADVSFQACRCGDSSAAQGCFVIWRCMR